LPLWGTFIGSASSALGMDVTVTVTEEGRAAAPTTTTLLETPPRPLAAVEDARRVIE
jgi:hypothetical protein